MYYFWQSKALGQVQYLMKIGIIVTQEVKILQSMD